MRNRQANERVYVEMQINANRKAMAKENNFTTLIKEHGKRKKQVSNERDSATTMYYPAFFMAKLGQSETR